MARKLYITNTSPFGARVRLTAAFTGASFEEIPPPGGAGSAEMAAISYFGKMPAIDFGDRVMIESIPLMEYLVDEAGGSALMLSTPAARLRMRSIMAAHDNQVLSAIWPMFLQLRSGKPDMAIVSSSLDAGTQRYATLTAMFDGRGGFVIDGTPTLADLCIAPFGVLFNLLYPMFGKETPFASGRLAEWWGATSTQPVAAPVLGVMREALAKAYGPK